MHGFIKKNLSVLIILFVTVLFFYKFFFLGLLPFPGDLLVGNYEPYRSEIPGVPHKGQGADVVRQIYPWKHFTIEQLKIGELPLWNPYTFSGNPHLSNLQPGVFYPLNILFFILPFMQAWGIYIVLQYILSSVFCFLYLRQIGLNKISAIFGSVAFSFSTFFTVWAWYGNIGHSLSFLPLALFCIEKMFQSQKIRWFFLLTFSFVFSISAGYVQLSIYIFIISLLYAIFKFYSLQEKHVFSLFFIVAAILLSIPLSAVQILPLYEVLSHSARLPYTYDVLMQRLIPPLHPITLLIPDFFGNSATFNYFLQGDSNLERSSFVGVWPLIFVFFCLFVKRTFYKSFFFAAAIISYFSVLALQPVAAFHSIGIPFISTGLPTRALSIFVFSVSVLAAIGMDSYLKNPQLRKKIVKVQIFFVILFILILSGTFYENSSNMDIARRNMILPFGIFIVGCVLLFIKQIPKKIAALFIITFTVFELFYSFQKFNSFVRPSFLYPEAEIMRSLKNVQGINRHWGYGSAGIDSNFQIMSKTYTTSGYDPLYIKRYGEFVFASKDGKLPSGVPRSVADILPGYGPSELKENPYRQRALDLTGVRFVLNKKNELGIDSAFDPRIYGLTYEKSGWQIYENKQVLPRIHLFGRYQILKDDEEIIEKLYSPFDYQNIVILEEKLPDTFNIRPDETATVSALTYTPNKVTFTTNSKEDQIVFLSDNFYPGWRVFVNGNEEKVYRANYTFRAVPLKAGSNNVEFIYQPFSFTLGLIVTGGGGVCLMVFILLLKKRNGGENN